MTTREMIAELRQRVLAQVVDDDPEVRKHALWFLESLQNVERNYEVIARLKVVAP